MKLTWCCLRQFAVGWCYLTHWGLQYEYKMLVEGINFGERAMTTIANTTVVISGGSKSKAYKSLPLNPKP